MPDVAGVLLRTAGRRPLSTAAAACAVAVAVFETGQIANGGLHLAALDHPDGTTLLMLCGLMLAAVVAFRQCSDLQAFSYTWVSALSSVLAYEALYERSRYLAPFGRGMPPPELREFVLQLAVAATVLTGFAHHHGRDQVYLLDRGTKAASFLVYYTLPAPVRPCRGRIIGIAPDRPGVP